MSSISLTLAHGVSSKKILQRCMKLNWPSFAQTLKQSNLSARINPIKVRFVNLRDAYGFLQL